MKRGGRSDESIGNKVRKRPDQNKYKNTFGKKIEQDNGLILERIMGVWMGWQIVSF